MCCVPPLPRHLQQGHHFGLFFFLGWETAVERAARRKSAQEGPSASGTEKAMALDSDGPWSAKELFFSALVSSSVKWGVREMERKYLFFFFCKVIVRIK